MAQDASFRSEEFADLSAEEVVERMDSLGPDELAALMEWEQANKNRVTVKRELAERLQQKSEEIQKAEESGEKSQDQGPTVKQVRHLRPDVISREERPEHVMEQTVEAAQKDHENREKMDLPPEELDWRLAQQKSELDASQADYDQRLKQFEQQKKEIEEAVSKADPQTLQERAELAHNYPGHFEDPTEPGVVETANVDDATQVHGRLLASSEALRAVVAASLADREENGSMHYLASKMADEGKPYYPLAAPATQVFDPEKHQEMLDQEEEDRKTARETVAKKVLEKLNEEGNGLISESTSDTSKWDYGDYNEPAPMSGAWTGGISIGQLASRLDFPHEFVGVVTDLDLGNLNHPLAQVTWPADADLDPQWIALTNLRYEGEGLDLLSDEERESLTKQSAEEKDDQEVTA